MDDPEQLEDQEPAGLPGADGPREDPRPVRIEVVGLSVYTHHGVGDAEREVGQRLVLDVSLALDGCDATASDRLEDTIDYGDVCREVASVAQARSHRTLERLCATIADHLVDRYAADSVTVRAAKPEPPIALAVEEVAVELSRVGASETAAVTAGRTAD
ncbi:hypothetical protein BH24ACT25_BH24ACT25_03840 [soil metagenome]